MNAAFKANNDDFNSMEERLRNESWILCGDSFRPSDRVITNLSNNFPGNDSLVVKLPIEYASKFGDLFKAMGVRDEIGVKDLILVVRNLVEGNEGRDLSTREIDSVIKILEQIVQIQKDAKRGRKVWMGY